MTRRRRSPRAEPLEPRTLFAFPSITQVSVPVSVYEGRSALVTGRFTDADFQPETHTVRFEWGDGTPDTVQDLRAGFTNFNADHIYADDLPGVSGDLDRREIRVTVTDALGFTSSPVTRFVRLLNIEPSLTLPDFVRALEGTPLTIAPQVYEPGADVLTYDWRVTRGDGSGPLVFQGATRDLTFTPPDDGQYMAALTVTDDDGGSVTRWSYLFAYNAAPTLAVSGAASADEGSPYVLDLVTSDPGADTILRWTIDWGDGQAQAVDGNPPSVTHAYDGPGHYTVRATATDEDGSYGAPLLGVSYAAGDGDPSFGAGGRATIDFPRANKVITRDAVAYPDGRVLVLASHDAAYTTNHTTLARFNPDGSFDGSFSGDGRVYEPDAITTGSTLALQADGKIVVAGASYTHVVARRYNPDGSRDATFGSGGEARLPLPLGISGVADAATNDVLALPGGKVLIAGRIGSNATAIVLKSDGTPDATFGGGDGVYDVPLPANTRTTAFYAAALAPDGRIGLAGNLFSSTFDSYVYAAVLRPDGTPDPAFSDDGFVTTSLSHLDYTGRGANGFAAAFQPDGKLLVGGESIYQPWPLLRYRTDGALDTSFGGDGLAETAWTPLADARLVSLRVLSDGKILSAGIGDGTATSDRGIALTRHNPDGTLDTTFGTNGKRLFAVTPSWQELPLTAAVLPAPGGKIVVASTLNGQVMLTRLDANGSTDPNFGDQGTRLENRFAFDQGGNGMVLLKLPDNKILAVHQPSSSSTDLWLARFHADGSVDSSFGEFGRVAAAAYGWVRAVIAAPGGKIVIAGAAGVSRFNADGSPDLSFGTGGVVIKPLGATDDNGGNLVEVGDVAVDGAGRVIVAGPARDQLRVARLNPDGSPDVSFGDAGLFKGFTDMWAVLDVALQPDGKVLVGTGGIVRLTAGGAPDPTFGGGDGLAPIPQPSDPSADPRSALNYVTDILVRPDGRILAVGGSRASGGSSGGYEVAALLPDGSPDPSFGGGDGRVTAPLPGVPGFPDGSPVQIALDPRGRILVGGYGPDSGETTGRYAVLRLFPDGVTDYAFGRDGVASAFSSSAGSGEAAAAMLVLDDGDVLIGGSDSDTIYGRLVVTRFHADAARELAVSVGNKPPVASAGPDVAAIPGRPVTLTGTFTDPSPSDAHTFHWKVTDVIGVTVAQGDGQSITFTPQTTQRYTATFTVTDDDGASSSDTAFVDAAPAVVGRWLFYDNSVYDGHLRGPNRADNDAVATDKRPLRSGGTASFANVSGYSRGINGVMIDVAGDMPLTALVGVAMNVGLKMGTAGDPATWPDAPRPTLISVFPGDGGSDRIVLTWPDGAIRNTWLRVTVRDVDFNGGFGLPDDTFLFGNLVGDATDAGALKVDAADVAATRAAGGRRVTITTPADHNRDGRVNALDQAIVRAAQGRNFSPLSIPIPAPAPAAAPPAQRRRPGARDVLSPP